MTSAIDPVQLVGLKQALYVMESIIRNSSEPEIIRMLGGDEQLFYMWKSFLWHNDWITETSDGWIVTPKGKLWDKQVKSR